MRTILILILSIMLSGCASSLTQKVSTESDTGSYEINLSSGLKIKKSVLKAIDSLVNVTISKRVISNDSVITCHFVINIDELNWYCPERTKIEKQSFAVGIAGGLIGSTIWGKTNFTTIYGVSKLKVIVNRGSDTLNITCNDTVNFKESYLSYSNSKTKKKAMCGAFAKSIINLMVKVSDKEIMTSGNWE